MDLEVVLLGSSFPLERCLRQIGTPYRIADLKETLPQNSAVYLAPVDSESCRKCAEAVLRKGKAVIVPESMQRCLKTTPLLFTYPNVFVNPEEGSIPKIFTVGNLLPREEVAIRPTYPTARYLLRLFTQAYEEQGLFFPALSFYPHGYKTLFSFRVDADEYDPAISAAFFGIAAPYSKGTTVFFSATNFLNAVPLIQKCIVSGFEIGSHSFYHYTYKSSRQNLYNIRKAADFFDRLGIPRKGYAAPHGRWNQGLQDALENSGYSFSSDFAYDYDGYPSFPYQKNGFSKVLQIPIHPVCSGVCLEAAQRPLTHHDLAGYFKSVFEQKYRAGEPIIFYDHPTAWTVEQFALIDQWFSMARYTPNIWICQLGEFADWCLRRDLLKLKISQEPHGSRIDISCTGSLDAGNTFALNLYRKGSEEYAQVRLAEKKSSYESAGLSFFERKIPDENDDGGTPLHKRSVFRSCKQLIKRSLDWETVTPPGEIIVEDLGSLAKKTIRSMGYSGRATSRNF